MSGFTGREKEMESLEKVYQSDQAELVAIYGRRRIGKTTLVRHLFSERPYFFEITGTRGANKAEQLLNFARIYSRIFNDNESISTPKTWNDAFDLLYTKFKSIKSVSRMVVFIDELPWLASKKSGFMQALEYYWNRYFSSDQRVIFILCGSASSWMIKHVINNRGGLYGRLTRSIRLLPFNLKEVENLLRSHFIEMDRKQIIELYLAIGGVPQYLNLVERGMSTAAAINSMFFEQNAQLYPEFQRIFRSLFDDYDAHMRIVKALALKYSGLTQEEVLKSARLTSGGSSTEMLRELEESGFIAYKPSFGKKNLGKYLLIDEYSLFYITWIESAKKMMMPSTLDADYWFKVQRSQKWKSWSGYAFETLCLKHMQHMKHALGISGVKTVESGWSFIPKKGASEKGAQIDLVIDRADNCMNLVEIKYSDTPFTIDKRYAENLKHKKALFREKTGTKKTLFTTLLTPYGLSKNMHAAAVVDVELTVDDLF